MQAGPDEQQHGERREPIVAAPGRPGIGRRDEDRGGERQTRPRGQHQQAEGAGMEAQAGIGSDRHDEVVRGQRADHGVEAEAEHGAPVVDPPGLGPGLAAAAGEEQGEPGPEREVEGEAGGQERRRGPEQGERPIRPGALRRRVEEEGGHRDRQSEDRGHRHQNQQAAQGLQQRGLGLRAPRIRPLDHDDDGQSTRRQREEAGPGGEIGRREPRHPGMVERQQEADQSRREGRRRAAGRIAEIGAGGFRPRRLAGGAALLLRTHRCGSPAARP